MRGCAIGLLAVLVAGTAWLLAPRGNDDVVITEPDSRPSPTADDKPEEPPERSDLAGSKSTGAEDPTAVPTNAFRVPITLIAHAVDKEGLAGPNLNGFGFRLTTDRGDLMVAEQSVFSGYVLKLGAGSFELHATMADRIAAGPTKFTITRSSTPITLRLPFRTAETVLALEVLDQATKARIAQFRLTIETVEPGSTQVKTRFVPKPDANPYSIEAERGQKVVVKIEAEDYEPAKPVTVTFDGKADKLEHKVFLVAAMKFTGVSFDVSDRANHKIPHLLVTAERRDETDRYRPLWRRRSNREQGDYKLPSLAPGHYRVELRSVDQDGIPSLHLPHRYEFRFTGNEHIHEMVALESGGGIELRLTDLNGRTIGKGVTVELTLPDGQVRESVWWPVIDGQPDPKLVRSADHLVQDHPARLDPCVSPGSYSIKLQWNDGPAVKRAVLVRAGETTVVAVQLSRN